MPIRKKTHQNGGNRPTMQTDKKPQNTTPNPAPDMTLEEQEAIDAMTAQLVPGAKKRFEIDVVKNDLFELLLELLQPCSPEPAGD